MYFKDTTFSDWNLNQQIGFLMAYIKEMISNSKLEMIASNLHHGHHDVVDEQELWRQDRVPQRQVGLELPAPKRRSNELRKVHTVPGPGFTSFGQTFVLSTGLARLEMVIFFHDFVKHEKQRLSSILTVRRQQQLKKTTFRHLEKSSFVQLMPNVVGRTLNASRWSKRSWNVISVDFTDTILSEKFCQLLNKLSFIALRSKKAMNRVLRANHYLAAS
jgi:hypothetical protein